MKTIIIKGELTDLNNYIRVERGNKFGAANLKRQMTQLVALQVRKYPKIPTPAIFCFDWFLPNEMKDPDNIAFAKKFVLDGLMLANKLDNDGWEQVRGFNDRFFVDKKNPRVELWSVEAK